jgi:LysM repeat protein
MQVQKSEIENVHVTSNVPSSGSEQVADDLKNAMSEFGSENYKKLDKVLENTSNVPSSGPEQGADDPYNTMSEFGSENRKKPDKVLQEDDRGNVHVTRNFSPIPFNKLKEENDDLKQQLLQLQEEKADLKQQLLQLREKQSKHKIELIEVQESFPRDITEESKGKEIKKEKQNDGGDSSRHHTVQQGDTLSKIAKIWYENGNLWKQIYDKNKGVVGDDPNVINPGQKLYIP